MKRSLLQALLVLLAVFAIWLYEHRYQLGLSRRVSPLRPRTGVEAVPLVPSIKLVLPCGRMGNMQVEFTSDPVLPKNAKETISAIEAHWRTLWPCVEKALWDEIRDYGREDSLRKARAFLVVLVPEEGLTKTAEWSIGITFKPYDGEWVAEMRGLDTVVNCTVAF